MTLMMLCSNFSGSNTRGVTVEEVLDSVLLVTLPLGRGAMFIKLEKPNGRLRPLGNLCKGYVVIPCQAT
jgi:hypothetical protein